MGLEIGVIKESATVLLGRQIELRAQLVLEGLKASEVDQTRLDRLYNDGSRIMLNDKIKRIDEAVKELHEGDSGKAVGLLVELYAEAGEKIGEPNLPEDEVLLQFEKMERVGEVLVELSPQRKDWVIGKMLRVYHDFPVVRPIINNPDNSL